MQPNKTGPVVIAPEDGIDVDAVLHALRSHPGGAFTIDPQRLKRDDHRAALLKRYRPAMVVDGLKPAEGILTYLPLLAREIPVVIVSRQGSPIHAARAMQAGAIWYSDDSPEQLAALADDVEDLVQQVGAPIEARLYRGLFEHMLNGFAYHRLVVDEEGKPIDFVFLAANEAFERMTGLDRREIIGRSIRESQPGFSETDLHWVDLYGEVALGGEPRYVEMWSENLKRWFGVRVFSPEALHFAVVFNDISERKRREEEMSDSLKRTSTLLREIHHRVKNNMQIIDSFLHLQAAVEGVTTGELVQRSHERIHAMAMVHELLYRSVGSEALPLKEYIVDLVRDLLAMHDAGSVELVAAGIEAAISARIVVPLGLIVAEIINNCIKHAFSLSTGRGDRVFVDVRRDGDDEEGTLMLAVADNGPGMALPGGVGAIDLREMERAIGGSGLGLQLIASLSQQIEAATRVVSNNGTRFEIRVPKVL